jgi:PPOX class probable F420-dependent enzyme
MLETEARQLVTSNALAHLVTLNPDGSPHVTLAWAGLDDDEIVMGTLSDQRKLRNMRRDPRVTVSFETGRMNSFGLIEYLVVHGRARVVPGGAPELLQELAYVYIGQGTKFPPMPDPPPGFVTRIAVEKVGGVGPWTS